MIYILFSKFQIRREVFSFYGLRQSDEGAATDIIYDFCWPKYTYIYIYMYIYIYICIYTYIYTIINILVVTQ